MFGRTVDPVGIQHGEGAFGCRVAEKGASVQSTVVFLKAFFVPAIVLAGDVKDFATRDLLQQILNDEDAHMDEIEELQDQIEQMTLPIFLTTQVRE